jgi:hypothetical protein
MARGQAFGSDKIQGVQKKKTRQGQSKNTKFGNKLSKKYYKKRTVGQGG